MTGKKLPNLIINLKQFRNPLFLHREGKYNWRRKHLNCKETVIQLKIIMMLGINLKTMMIPLQKLFIKKLNLNQMLKYSLRVANNKLKVQLYSKRRKPMNYSNKEN